MALEIKINKKNCTLNFDDSLCIYEMSDFKQQLADTLPEDLPLKLNLAKVGACDTAGLQLLIALEKLCSQRSQKFSITAASPPVEDLFTLYSLEDWKKANMKE